MTCSLQSYQSAVVLSYQADGRVIVKGCVPLNLVCGWQDCQLLGGSQMLVCRAELEMKYQF